MREDELSTQWDHRSPTPPNCDDLVGNAREKLTSENVMLVSQEKCQLKEPQENGKVGHP